MFLEILLAIFIGVNAGIITGLVPGIHINLVGSFILVQIALLTNYFSIEMIVIFIIIMSLTHTFIDFIPSIVFGVPDSDTTLSVLPGHALVHDGRAYEAVFLSSIGSFFGVIMSVYMGILFFFALEYVYGSITNIIPYFLLSVIIILILFEKGYDTKFWAFIIILFSGGYGLLILNFSLISNPLLLLFTGMFGIATLFHSLNSDDVKFPSQKFDISFKIDKDFFKGTLVGTICASLCSVTPGIGNAQAATLASVFMKKLGQEMFIVVLSMINTINFVLSVITLYLINRARNGSIYVISQIKEITYTEMCVYIGIMLLISFLIFFITIKLSKIIIKIVMKLNFRIITISIIIFLFILVGYIDKLIGLIVMIGASFLGLLCILLNVKRVHLMTVLIIPVIFNLI